jgi:hypothetical protein
MSVSSATRVPRLPGHASSPHQGVQGPRYQRAKGAARHIVIESADPDTLRSRWAGSRLMDRVRAPANSSGLPGTPRSGLGSRGDTAGSLPVDGSQPLLGLLLEWRRAGHLGRGGSFTQAQLRAGRGASVADGWQPRCSSVSEAAEMSANPPKNDEWRHYPMSGSSSSATRGASTPPGVDPRLEAQSPTLGERSAPERTLDPARSSA